MKGNDQVVAALNDTLRNAHSAFMQFAKHALWFQDKGYGKLAEMEAGEAAKEKAYIRPVAKAARGPVGGVIWVKMEGPKGGPFRWERGDGSATSGCGAGGSWRA